MAHNSDLLTDRLHALEALQRRHVGSDATPLVCSFCYSTFDAAGCLCGRMTWTLLGAAILELRLTLEERHDKIREAA